MPDQNEAPSQPVAAEAPQSVETKGGGNVGTHQAVARMLQAEQDRAAKSAPAADSVAQAETPTTETPAQDAAPATSAEETVQAEAEAPAPSEAETETKDALSNEEHTLDPKLQEKINRRIGKEVAKRKELEARLNEMQLQLQAQAQASQQKPAEVPIVPLPANAPPLANINSVNELTVLQEQAKEARRWAQEQLDNEVGEVQLGDRVINAKELKAIIRNANKTLEDEIPARANFLTQKHQVQQVAYEKFPFLRDKSSPEYVQAQSAYLAMPWLRNLPNADWIIGVQIEGLKALKAKEEAKARGKTPSPVKTAAPPASQTAVSSNGNVARVASGTRQQQEISAIRNAQSKKGGVTANEAIAALTKIEQLRTR